MAGRKDGDVSLMFQQRKKGSPAEQRSHGGLKKEEGLKASAPRSQQLPSATASTPVDQSVAFEDDDVEPVLREFDLEAKYGPCLGMTRMERWERAERLGLSPPQIVRDFLQHAGGSQNCVWHNRV